jgi:hypothetical protein
LYSHDQFPWGDSLKGRKEGLEGRKEELEGLEGSSVARKSFSRRKAGKKIHPRDPVLVTISIYVDI